MIANYHSHTTRCRHARGTEKEYVEKAIGRGLKVFGFSDHAPQFFPGDYYSTMRMFPEELPAYCHAVRSLQEEYKGRIEIPLGVEAEYYPCSWKELIPYLQDQGIEYMILGQHWASNEYDAPYSGEPKTDVKALSQYCDQVITAMETGKFTYIAHPDIYRFVGDRRAYLNQMRRICVASKQTNTPLEINLLGLAAHRNYPNPLFWEIASEEGCQVILGIDAHAPEEIADRKPEMMAMAMVREFGLHLLEAVPFKKL